MLVALCVLFVLAGAATGQSDALPAGQPGASAPAASAVRLPLGTPLEVELVDPLSSRTSLTGDRFAIRLVAPISVDGVEVVAAGATGQGEVIDAAHAGMGGRQGKLLVSARFLEINGQRVRIRGMTLNVAGKSRVGLATGVLLVPYAGVGAVLIQGGEIEMPRGTRATVRLAEDVTLASTNSTKSATE
jgi:hypothetical protein